jgi:hypothetical protein
VQRAKRKRNKQKFDQRGTRNSLKPDWNSSFRKIADCNNRPGCNKHSSSQLSASKKRKERLWLSWNKSVPTSLSDMLYKSRNRSNKMMRSKSNIHELRMRNQKSLRLNSRLSVVCCSVLSKRRSKNCGISTFPTSILLNYKTKKYRQNCKV